MYALHLRLRSSPAILSHYHNLFSSQTRNVQLLYIKSVDDVIALQIPSLDD